MTVRGTLGIICHGGAGVLKDKERSCEGLVPALEEGYRLLRQSADALEAVVAAVRIMEDDPVFNCGVGSSLNLEGRAEMDAAVMSQDGRFGGVCCLTDTKNPVLVAKQVMLETDHLLLGGEGAKAFARRMGFEEHQIETAEARGRLDELRQKGESPYFPRFAEMMKSGESPLGTAGAVAIDKHGRVAAATSSGGIIGRLPGRIGDSAMPGAGTYAGPSGAVSCTGHGEAIMKLLLARDIVERMKTLPASVALTLALTDAKRLKVRCGAIGFDARGGVCFGHTTPEMAWGYMVAERKFMFYEAKKKTDSQ